MHPMERRGESLEWFPSEEERIAQTMKRRMPMLARIKKTIPDVLMVLGFLGLVWLIRIYLVMQSIIDFRA